MLFAAGSVLVFFLMFVLPQFAGVLRDFNVKLDPIVVVFLGLSDFLRAHTDADPRDRGAGHRSDCG